MGYPHRTQGTEEHQIQEGLKAFYEMREEEVEEAKIVKENIGDLELLENPSDWDTEPLLM